MSNAIALKETNFTPEQYALISSTIAKGATPDELKLFLYRCKNMGLDPLKPGQIHFVKYGNSPGTIVVGIEGFRSIAGRTGMLSGVARGVIRNEKGVITHGWAEIMRSDWKSPAREEVPMSEYNTGKGPWAKMPETMIKKVAEAAALRMAFPDVLGGVYTNEEMDQAGERKSGGIHPEQPPAGEGIENTPISPRVSKGSYAKRTISAMSAEDCIHFLDINESKQGLSMEELQDIESVKERLALLENQDPVEEVETPICEGCEKPFSVSKYPDRITGVHNWYCFKCKVSKPRQ